MTARWFVGLLGLLVVGCAGPVPDAAPTTPATPTATTTRPTVELPGPQPVVPSAVTVSSVAIPAIGVDTAPVETLALLPDGSLAAPVDFARTGWFAAGAVPGETGPAVIAGHVDSVAGPAVFYRLPELQVGDEVLVGLSDGRTVAFRVDGVQQAPKDDFPTEAVYGPTPDAQLRLITCSGEFDRVERSYLDNTVVFASLA